MKVSLSWLRDFVDVPGTAEEIGAKMSLRGLALEGIETHGDDHTLDFDVAANRPDCLSIRGIARPIATPYALPLNHRGKPSPRDARAVTPGEISSDRKGSDVAPAIPVTIAEPDLCGRYVAAIADVRIGPSPDWLQARLI